MSESVVFNCTALMGSNKSGYLKADKCGYYKVVLGAFDFLNSAGENYPFNSAKHLFKSSSSLMRRIQNGLCKGEFGHPSKESGMSYGDYIERILTIKEKFISHHIRSLTVDKNAIKDKDDKSIIAVIGEVKPCGPYGDNLKESMENPDENVAFSLRSLVNQSFERGVVQKHIKVLVTYDYVAEGGISIANKYDSPGLEGLNDEMPITPHILNTIESHQPKQLGLEQDLLNIATIKTELGWSKTEIVTIPSVKW